MAHACASLSVIHRGAKYKACHVPRRLETRFGPAASRGRGTLQAFARHASAGRQAATNLDAGGIQV